MNLNNFENIYKQDPGLVALSIKDLSKQIEQVKEDAKLIKITDAYKGINKVVVNGMGGSNLGARMLESCFKEEFKCPLIVEPGYQVPGFVDDKTLYLISSYSGNTEEPLSVYGEVVKRGAKVVGITSSHKENKLEKLMIDNDIPGFIFSPLNNPSNQPRMGLGYSIFGMLFLLKKAGVLEIDEKKIDRVIDNLIKSNEKLIPEINSSDNVAKMFAQKMKGKIPILIGAEFLEGNLHILRNQFCENSKNYADYLVLPELNHYAMESLANPKGNKKNLIFWFFDSDSYNDRVIKRNNITKEIVKKNNIEFIEYKTKSSSKLSQCVEVLQLGSWVTFYLSMLNNVNPSLIPWVDWFKEELG
jgi:glucose/mannose-6-phosphate isomerase